MPKILVSSISVLYLYNQQKKQGHDTVQATKTSTKLKARAKTAYTTVTQILMN